MATFVIAKDATPEETADFLRLLAEVQPAETVTQAAMCPACGVRVAGASGLCAECAQTAGRLSFETQVQQAEAEADVITEAGTEAHVKEYRSLLCLAGVGQEC